MRRVLTKMSAASTVCSGATPFTLLYPPCVAAISTVKSELGGRYAVAVFALQVCVAWVVAFLVHAAGLALGLA